MQDGEDYRIQIEIRIGSFPVMVSLISRSRHDRLLVEWIKMNTVPAGGCYYNMKDRILTDS